MPIRERAVDLWTRIAYAVSGVTAFIGGLSLNEWALIIGILSTVAVTGYNIYSKRRHLKISEAWLARNNTSINCADCPKVTPRD